MFDKKILVILLISFLLFSFRADLVRGAVGASCDTDANCGANEECICDPNPGDGNKEGKCQLKCTGICIKNPLKTCTFEQLIESLFNFIFVVAIAIVPIMIIVGGFYFLTSGGNPDKIRTAKSIVLWTIVGLVIVLLAKGIISVIKQIIGG